MVEKVQGGGIGGSEARLRGMGGLVGPKGRPFAKIGKKG